MSENRPQATPTVTDRRRRLTRDLTEVDMQRELTRDLIAGDIHGNVTRSDAARMARTAIQRGWSKPRTVKSPSELDALPEDTVIRVQKRKKAKFATYYEKYGRNQWLALDPSDRSDGEELWDAQVIVRFNEAITVLFDPGDTDG